MPTLIAPEDLHLPTLNLRVKKGDAVDVPKEAVDSLIEQGWKTSKAAPRKAAAKSTPPKSGDANQGTEPDTKES